MIVVGGEALMDLILRPDGSLRAAPGGGPYNTARTVGRLGLPVAFMGGLSDDAFGRRLHDGLVVDGVSDALAVRTSAPTTLAVAEIDPAGVATYRFYVSGTSAVALDAGHLPAIADRLVTVTAIHVGTLGLVLDPLAGAMEGLVAHASDETVVMIDLNGRPSATPDHETWRARVHGLLRRCDVVKVSTDDLAMFRPDLSPDDAVAYVLDHGPAVVLWTAGADAVRVVTVRSAMSITPPPVAVVDTVGAGDAFGGGFLAAWIGSGRGRAELESDEALAAAVRHAVRIAGFTCTRAGAEPPTAAELAAWGAGR